MMYRFHPPSAEAEKVEAEKARLKDAFIILAQTAKNLKKGGNLDDSIKPEEILDLYKDFISGLEEKPTSIAKMTPDEYTEAELFNAQLYTCQDNIEFIEKAIAPTSGPKA